MATQRAVTPASQPVEVFYQVALLSMLASGYCAMLGSRVLDWPSTLAAGAALALRALFIARLVRFEIPSHWVSLSTLFYILFYPIDYYFLSRDFLNSTVHLVFFVAAVKVLTAKTPRDYFFVKIIALLEMLAAALLSTNPSFFLFLATFLLSTVATLAGGEIRQAYARSTGPTQATGVRLSVRLAWLSGSLSLGILLLSAGLFFVLPRTARAALERFLPATGRVSGFSEEVSLGEPGEIRRQGNAVFHVRFPDNERPAGLKWRGLTLAEFDGLKWYDSDRTGRPLRPESGLLQLSDDDQRRRPGPRVTYEVLLHGGSDVLFIAGLPEFIRVPAPVVYRSQGEGLRVPMDTNGLRYNVVAYFEPNARPSVSTGRLTPELRNHHLRLPPFDRRVLELARRITGPFQHDYDRAVAIERHLRSAYGYSLENSPPEGADPLAWFLFERRKGHCEYFASAMAVMLRASWIPARVVTGFQSGVYNPISGWHVVRSSDAHAWVEAWLPGEGWVTFDPTPPAPDTGSLSLLERVGLYLDAADIFWQEWIIGYDLERQLTLAFRFDQSRRRFSLRALEELSIEAKARLERLRTWVAATPPRAAWSLLVFAAALACVPLLLKRRASVLQRRRLLAGRADSTDASRMYRRMLGILEKRGLVKPPALTPLEFARMAGDIETARAVEQFTIAYNQLRFGAQTGAAARLSTLLDRIERLPR